MAYKMQEVSKQREVPYEVMFKLSDAVQDPIKKNRYWWDFPSQWSNQLDKDPILGIRSIYLTKTNRLAYFKLTISLREDNENETLWYFWYGDINFYIDGTDTIVIFTTKFNQYWYDALKNNGQGKNDYSSSNYTLDSNSIHSHFDYDSNTHKCLLSIGASNSFPKHIIITDTNNQTHNCLIRISIEPKNQDTYALFNIDYREPLEEATLIGIREISIPVWTRYNCYILSSLADDDANNFLGHTRNANYTPIKYYRLKNKNKKFWVELYETRYHDVPVTLPIDKIPNLDYDSTQIESEINKMYLKEYIRDDLFIEAIVIFNSNAMI